MRMQIELVEGQQHLSSLRLLTACQSIVQFPIVATNSNFPPFFDRYEVRVVLAFRVDHLPLYNLNPIVTITLMTTMMLTSDSLSSIEVRGEDIVPLELVLIRPIDLIMPFVVTVSLSL